MSKDNDDIIVQDIKDNEIEMSELSTLKEETQKDNKKKEYSDEEIKQIISNYDPPAILDWPNIPYKTIFVVLLLLFSSILFLHKSINNFKSPDGSWKEWLPYGVLGSLLIIPGVFYGFILINILIGRKGYTYDLLPDLSENN